MRYLFLFFAFVFSLSPSLAQGPPGRGGGERPTEPPTATRFTDEPPVVTEHKSGKGWTYTATAGYLPLKSSSGEIDARIFHIAYTRKDAGDTRKRPLLIAFNGGPGSASVWLHLGLIGPKRIPMKDGGELPPPPYALVENESTWLEFADLVFLDPVGTGYSRAVSSAAGQRYWGLNGDIASVAEAIRVYLIRNDRWGSPLFLAGESYGTLRAAGLAGALVEDGIALNGVVLISTILNYQTARFNTGNDLPYILFLPTYTATAFYHKKLAPDLQKNLTATLAEAEKFAEGEYATALMKGDRLTEAETVALAKKVARYTGLSEQYVRLSNLRIEIQRFCKELRRDDGWTVGRLDSRIKGRDARGTGDFPNFDPSEAAIRPPYTATFSDYIRRDLNFKTDTVYYILGGGIGQWEYPQNQYADTSESLRRALAKNPYLKVFVAEGYYDLATPYFAAEYTMSHMNRPVDLKGNFTTRRYQAGHMMYIHEPSLIQLTNDVREWLNTAVKP
jgi:carboxypeptidase C (cathepsin A)